MKDLLLKSVVLLGIFPFGVPAFSEVESAVGGGDAASPKTVADAPAVPEGAFCYSYIGVALDALSPAELGGDLKNGVRVIYVLENAPAAKAGVLKGDILTTLDDQKIFFPNQFAALIRTYEPGSKIELGVLRDGNALRLPAVVGQRRILSKPPAPGNLPSDDIRLYINGREISFGDRDAFDCVSLTPNGIFIREESGVSPEVRRLVSSIHEKIPNPKKVLSSLRLRYDEARAAAIGKTRQTFSQVFFGHGNAVIIVGNEHGRQVTVSRGDDEEVLFRGNCSTQEEIDAIPAEAKAIIDSFTTLKPFTPVPIDDEDGQAQAEDEGGQEAQAEDEQLPPPPPPPPES